MASETDDDDLALILGIGAGDTPAEEAFDRRFRPLLQRFLKGRVPPEDQLDVIQEVLMAALQKIRSEEGFRRSSALGTWLIAILKHKIADYWAAQKRQEQYLVPIR